MRTPLVLLPVVLLLAVAACRSPADSGPGPRLALARESPGAGPLAAPSRVGDLGPRASARPGAEVLEGTEEVRAQTWAAARGLKRAGAWLALGLRVEGERVRLLGLRAHEGTGREGGAVEAESFRGLLEWALSRYARGQRGEVVLTLRRGEGP